MEKKKEPKEHPILNQVLTPEFLKQFKDSGELASSFMEQRDDIFDSLEFAHEVSVDGWKALQRTLRKITLSMFALTASQRFFLYAQPVNMRKSFDGLSGIVTTGMGKEVLSGDVYIFIGKSRDKIKLLVWEKAGFVLYYKRLEAGTFRLPKPGQLSLSYSEL